MVAECCAYHARDSSMSLRARGRKNHCASMASWPAMTSRFAAPTSGSPLRNVSVYAACWSAISGTADHMVRLYVSVPPSHPPSRNSLAKNSSLISARLAANGSVVGMDGYT